MERLIHRPFLMRLGLFCLSIIVFFLVGWLVHPTLHEWDERLGEVAWSLNVQENLPQEKRLIIVDIDERSIQSLGAWPWSRTQMANLLERLDRAQVQLKILDILFDSPQMDDGVLKAQLSRGVVGAQLFALDGNNVTRGALRGALNIADQSCSSPSSLASGYIASTGDLLSQALTVGHITPVVDPDGAIRQIPALVCWDKQLYPSLSVAGFLAVTDQKVSLTQGKSWYEPAWWLDFGIYRVPLDDHGYQRVSYRQPRANFISVSAVDVIQGRVDPELLKGSWVLVGSTAFGGGDAVPTPLGRSVGGVEVNAQAILAVLDDRTPYTPRAAWIWLLLVVAVMAIVQLIFLGQFKHSAFVLPILALAGVVGAFLVHSWALLTWHWWLGWLEPACFVVLSTGLMGVGELWRVRLERDRVYHNLATYLPIAVAKEVAWQGPSSEVQLSRKQACVMFIDLRNFSAYCEGRPPEETAMVLHLFYTTAAQVITEFDGVVEQMVGDSVMAVWDASQVSRPSQRATDAAKALWVALTRQLPTVSHRETPLLDIGMGLESGEVLTGFFGGAKRRVHTVLGETVTVASHLEKMTVELAYPIVVGPKLRDQVGEDFVYLGEFLIPGLVDVSKIYALPVPLNEAHAEIAYLADISASD